MTGQWEMESSDERFAQWMEGNLHRAATQFGLTVHGAPAQERRVGWLPTRSRL